MLSKEKVYDQELSQYVNKCREENEGYNAKIDNIHLKNIIESLKKDNEKVPKAKDLLIEYKEALKRKDLEIERLKKNNQELYDSIQKMPKLLKKIFLKEDVKLLKDN